MQPQRHPEPGTIIDSYRIVRKLGADGMGDIYEAWEEVLQRRVAIRFISPNAGSARSERFLGEARALAKLKHSNLVAVYTCGESDYGSYVAMEFIDGLGVDIFLETYPSGLNDLIRLFVQMAEGLASAHDNGILHRDLKPTNILIDHDLTAKLVDFALAKSDDSSAPRTAGHVMMGTLNYLPPELVNSQVNGQGGNRQSDIYSLGLVFYVMVTGAVPHLGETNLEVIDKIRNEALTFNPRLHLILPESLRALILKMTAKAAPMRYDNVHELLRDLKNLDLAKLPIDLGLSMVPQLILENKADLEVRCLQQGFEIAETRMILNLAANLHLRAPEYNRTGLSEKNLSAPKIKINEATFADALRRFHQAKNQVISRNVVRGRRKRRLSLPDMDLPWVQWTFLVCVILASAGYLIFNHVKLPKSSQVVDRMFASVARPRASFVHKVGDSACYHVSLNENHSPEKSVDEVDGDSPPPKVIQNGLGEYELNWKLTRRNGDEETWVSDAGATKVVRDAFLPSLSSEATSGAALQTTVVQFGETLDPLKVGHSNSTQLQTHRQGQEKGWSYTWECVVEGAGTFTLPPDAAPLETYKIRCHSDDGPTSVESFEYAPKIDLAVRRDRLLRQGRRQHFELIRYQLVE